MVVGLGTMIGQAMRDANNAEQQQRMKGNAKAIEQKRRAEKALADKENEINKTATATALKAAEIRRAKLRRTQQATAIGEDECWLLKAVMSDPEFIKIFNK